MQADLSGEGSFHSVLGICNYVTLTWVLESCLSDPLIGLSGFCNLADGSHGLS